MDKRTKYRILGTLVVIGLIVLLLPLFQGGKDTATPEAALVKAPPFPDQTVQVTSAAQTTPDQAPVANTEMNEQPDDTINTTKTAEVTTHVNSAALASIPAPPAVVPAPTSPVPTVASTSVAIEKDIATQKAAALLQKRVLQQDLRVEQKGKDLVNLVPRKSVALKAIPFVKARGIKAHRFAAVSASRLATVDNDNNGLIKLKHAVWVIQLGSFKNKTNALRLVNRLRAKGYRAFIQQFSTTASDTRVFVGPENKQASARILANRLENDLHLHGIIVSYQPLML